MMIRTKSPIACHHASRQLSQPGPSPEARECGIVPVTPKINTWIPHSSDTSRCHVARYVARPASGNA
jgi:hypothetical protein